MSEEMKYEWLPEDRWEWLVNEEVVGGKFCSQRSCFSHAATAFYREVRKPSGGQGRRIWYCCHDHMYGRRIENGVVLGEYMVGSNSWKRAKDRLSHPLSR